MPHPRTLPRRECLHCRIETVNQKYCSLECQWLYHHAATLKIAIATGKIGTDARRVLIALFGRKCEICGLTEWLGRPAPLLVDHINGRSWEHNLSNVRLICPNCDTFLPTFKGRNRGNGRPYRRDRYAQGLTF